MKLILAHTPKTGGTSLAHNLYSLFSGKNLSSLVFANDMLTPSQQKNHPLLRRRLYNTCLATTGADGAANPGLILPGETIDALKESILISGHIHTSIDFLDAFIRSLSTHHSHSRLFVLVTHRASQQAWLKSVVKFALIEARKSALSGNHTEFQPEWLTAAALFHGGNHSSDTLSAFLLDALIKSKASTYFQSQLQCNQRLLLALELSGIPCTCLSLESTRIDQLLTRVQVSLGLPSTIPARLNVTPSEPILDKNIDLAFLVLRDELNLLLDKHSTGCETLPDASSSDDLFAELEAFANDHG